MGTRNQRNDRAGHVNAKGIWYVVLVAVAALAFGVGLEAYSAQPESTSALSDMEKKPGILSAPRVVAPFDPARYVGRWYEIQSTQPGFQAGCSCVTADYGPVAPTRISVVNTCQKGPRVQRVMGKAAVADPKEPAKLEVSFPGFGSDLLNLLLKSNYWVVDLDPDYQWAVVSTRFRKPIWILARMPTLEAPVLEGIRARLDAEGFDVGELKETPQQGCTYPAATAPTSQSAPGAP